MEDINRIKGNSQTFSWEKRKIGLKNVILPQKATFTIMAPNLEF